MVSHHSALTTILTLWVAFASLAPCFSELNSISEIDQRLFEINSQTKNLPSRVIYPVGGTFGHRWEIQTQSKEQTNWAKIIFPQSQTLDNVVLVPEATFDTDKIKAYCLASEIRVTLMGRNKIVYEGKLPEPILRNAEPIFISFEQPEENVTGIYIETLSQQTYGPSLSLSEVFAFHNGLNVALGCEVVVSSQHKGQESRYLPEYLTDGQSSLGQPIHYNDKYRTNAAYTGFRSNKIEHAKEVSIELVLKKPQTIHEVRVLPDYLPVNGMISFFYGFGFPPSFRLELLDQNQQVVEVLHQGKFTNPGRNIPSFKSRGAIVSRVKLNVDQLYYSDEYTFYSFVLSEIQVINTQNRNIARDSELLIKGLNHNSTVHDYAYSKKLNDNITSRGELLDLESWIKDMVLKSNLLQEAKILTQRKNDLLHSRQQMTTLLLVVLFLVIVLITVITIKSRLRQKQQILAMRRQLANDLHDEIGSNLSSIGLMSHSLQDRELGEELREIVIDSEESLREMVWALSPRPISVLTKIREAASRLLSDLNVEFLIDHEHIWDELSLQTKQDLLFWTKEAMNNIRKHAKAKSVTLKFTQANSNSLNVCIQDDGIGMDVSHQLNNIEHLTRLKARASKLHGDFKVSSHPHHGTEVQLTFPIYSIA